MGKNQSNVFNVSDLNGGNHHDGSRLFIASVLKQCVADILAAPRASPDISMKYRLDSKMNHSASAKRFIDKNNDQFVYICNLLGYEAEWVERKMWKKINYMLANPHLSKGFKDDVQEV
jgi:hypothetical protein